MTSQHFLSHDSLHLLSPLCIHPFDKWFLSAHYVLDTRGVADSVEQPKAVSALMKNIGHRWRETAVE